MKYIKCYFVFLFKIQSFVEGVAECLSAIYFFVIVATWKNRGVNKISFVDCPLDAKTRDKRINPCMV